MKRTRTTWKRGVMRSSALGLVSASDLTFLMTGFLQQFATCIVRTIALIRFSQVVSHQVGWLQVIEPSAHKPLELIGKQGNSLLLTVRPA